MTNIRMDWKTLELTADGHAGGGKPGQNIICAGISALTMALLNQLLEEKDSNTKHRIDEKRGYIRIRANPTEKSRTRIRDYYRVIMTGLKAWEQAFPENIKTEEVNRNGSD